MINEEIEIREDYYKLSKQLINQLDEKSILDQNKMVIAICGESGSGKSVTSMCLKESLSSKGVESVILHQDNYYNLPPITNHKKRKSDINWVGPNELNLDLLQQHLNQFKAQKEQINAPLVDYKKNTFVQRKINYKQKSILIIEGVYTFFLDNLDYKIFLEKTYTETIEKRKKRTREVYDPFVETVLDIEHNIIIQLKEFAHLIVDKNYKITL